MLVASCTSGLCNRIHSLLGSKIVADALNRDFKIYWPKNSELDVGFNDIFDSDLLTVSESELSYLLLDARVTSKIYNAGLAAPHEYTNIQRDDSHDVIVVKSWTAPVFSGQFHTEEHRDKLRNLLPSIPFKRDIVSKASPQKYSSHIGIHIRYGDYRPEGPNHLDYFAGASEEAFKALMHRIASARPSIRFYVSCPNLKIKQSLSQHFDIDYLDINPYRSLDGVKDAILDLMNLSGCAFVFGSSSSQFSQFVGLLYNKPVGTIGGPPSRRFEFVEGPFSLETQEEEMLGLALKHLDGYVAQ
jgi:hypothetical protein